MGELSDVGDASNVIASARRGTTDSNSNAHRESDVAWGRTVQ